MRPRTESDPPDGEDEEGPYWCCPLCITRYRSIVARDNCCTWD